MANADGSVIFSCDLDSTKAQKKLSKLRDEISELNSKLEKETGNKMNLEKQLDAASQAAKANTARITISTGKAKAHRSVPVGFLRYMRGSIGKRLTVKHLTTVCLQSDKGQVKQLSLYSHTVFFATLRRTLRATVHFGAHTWESGVLIRSCARMHSSVLIREHLLSEKLTFALDGHGSAYEQHLSDRRLHDRVESIISVHSVTSMLCISSLTDTPDRSATKEKRVPR